MMNNKIDGKDITFTIPLRVDHEDRMNNLGFSIGWIVNTFDNTRILVGLESPDEDVSELIRIAQESRQHTNKIEVFVFPECKREDDGAFWRTKLLNSLATKVTSKFVANYDADVVIPCSAYRHALGHLTYDKADLVYPFSGLFVDIPSEWTRSQEACQLLWLILNYSPNQEVSIQKISEKGQIDIKHRESVGGVCIWNLESFLRIGGENEAFVSYGPEDIDRFNRAKKAGYNIYRVEGFPLIHIHHWRGPDSSKQNPHYEANVRLLSEGKE